MLYIPCLTQFEQVNKNDILGQLGTSWVLQDDK